VSPRESGSLEQDADKVILVHRPDAWEADDPRAGEADLIVAKHRNGPTAKPRAKNAMVPAGPPGVVRLREPGIVQVDDCCGRAPHGAVKWFNPETGSRFVTPRDVGRPRLVRPLLDDGQAATAHWKRTRRSGTPSPRAKGPASRRRHHRVTEVGNKTPRSMNPYQGPSQDMDHELDRHATTTPAAQPLIGELPQARSGRARTKEADSSRCRCVSRRTPRST